MTVALVVGLMLGLVGLGIWTGIGLLVAGFVGLALSFGNLALLQSGVTAWSLANSSTLAAIPLFILMGDLLADSRAARDLFNFITRFSGRLPSAPALGTVGVGAMISAVSGSLAAVTAIMTRTAYSRLRQEGFPVRQSLGLVASVGALGIMIPPSLTLIIYGSLTETPITSLFRVAILPGVVQAALFMVCAAWAWHRFARTGALAAVRETEPAKSTAGAWQFPVAIVLVIGGFVSGKVTPEEAAAVGVLLALGMNALNRELSWSRLRLATRRTVITTAMILLIVLGAQMISNTLAFQGVTRSVSLFIRAIPIPAIGILALVALLYILLGTVFDGLSMMVLTLPFIFPAVVALGRDPLWFGVMMVVCVQLAEISPPVGVNLFVAQHLTGEAIDEVWLGALPYLVALTLVLITLLVFPGFGLLLR